MRAQFIWQLVSFIAVNPLFCLLEQMACVSSTSAFAIRWLPTISNNVIHRFPGLGSTPSSRNDLSPELNRSYHEWNEQRLSELNNCLEKKNCGPNQSNVVLVTARWFDGQVAERVWKGVGPLRSGVSAYEYLRQMGHTTLFSKNFDEALDQYRMFPDLVELVIHDKAVECYANPECLQGPSNPTGIPAWKIFDFELSIVYFQDIAL